MFGPVLLLVIATVRKMESYPTVDATSFHFKSRRLSLRRRFCPLMNSSKVFRSRDASSRMCKSRQLHTRNHVRGVQPAYSANERKTSTNSRFYFLYVRRGATEGRWQSPSSEPLQRSRGRLMQSLAAAVEEHSISPPLRSSIPPFLPSLPLPPDSNDAGEKLWSGPHVSHPLPERDVEGGRRGEKITIQRGKEAAVSAECWEWGSGTDGWGEGDGEGERGINGKERGGWMTVVMGLMCNKLREGAFREALFSNSTHTTSKKSSHTNTLTPHTRTTVNSAWLITLFIFMRIQTPADGSDKHKFLVESSIVSVWFD